MAYLNRAAISSAIATPGASVRTVMGLGKVELIREDGVVVVGAGGGGGRGGVGKRTRVGKKGTAGVAEERTRCVVVW